MKIEIKESTEVKKPKYPYLAKTPDSIIVIVSEVGYQYPIWFDKIHPFGDCYNYKEIEFTPLPLGSQIIITQE